MTGWDVVEGAYDVLKVVAGIAVVVLIVLGLWIYVSENDKQLNRHYQLIDRCEGEGGHFIDDVCRNSDNSIRFTEREVISK